MDSKALINRRTAIGAALVAASPLLLPGRVRAQGTAAHADTFVVLLKGLYSPSFKRRTSACPRSTCAMART